VKVCSSRYALVMIEDLTWERIHARLMEKEHTRLIQANVTCERRAQQLAADLEQALGGHIQDLADAAESNGLSHLGHPHADTLVRGQGNGPLRRQTGQP